MPFCISLSRGEFDQEQVTALVERMVPSAKVMFNDNSWYVANDELFVFKVPQKNGSTLQLVGRPVPDLDGAKDSINFGTYEKFWTFSLSTNSM
ncbi:unnamed protein product [Clonostachys rosea]|uniref:Uncharacterized protein n=1 Tax=Bionectria ochroleuca TaxID=29856 RepID=A0ABY6URT7_BIOOC|nr:unnamed protein product [Clonostachys rosea]